MSTIIFKSYKIRVITYFFNVKKGYTAEDFDSDVLDNTSEVRYSYKSKMELLILELEYLKRFLIQN